MFVINRFPILAFISYVLAKRANFSEKMAKQLGMAMALQYACWKTGNWYGYRVKYYKEKSIEEQFIRKEKDLKKYECLDWLGETFLIDAETETVIGAALRRKPFNCAPEKFDAERAEILFRCANGDEEKMRRFEERIVKDFQEFLKMRGLSNPSGIKKIGRSFFQFWKKVRDHYRTLEFWRSL